MEWLIVGCRVVVQLGEELRGIDGDPEALHMLSSASAKGKKDQYVF